MSVDKVHNSVLTVGNNSREKKSFSSWAIEWKLFFFFLMAVYSAGTEDSQLT